MALTRRNLFFDLDNISLIFISYCNPEPVPYNKAYVGPAEMLQGNYPAQSVEHLSIEDPFFLQGTCTRLISE